MEQEGDATTTAWTPARLARLRELVESTSPPYGWDYIANDLGVNKLKAKKKADKEGFVKASIYTGQWTEERVIVLRALCRREPKLTCQAIADKIGVSMANVYLKAINLGIKQKEGTIREAETRIYELCALRPPLSFEAIAKELGIHKTTAVRWATELGIIKEHYRKKLRNSNKIPGVPIEPAEQCCAFIVTAEGQTRCPNAVDQPKWQECRKCYMTFAQRKTKQNLPSRKKRCEEQLRELCEREPPLTWPVIGKELGVDKSTAMRWADELGIKKKDAYITNWSVGMEAQLRELCARNPPLSFQAIGNELGIAKNSVQYWVDKLGIEKEHVLPGPKQEPVK